MRDAQALMRRIESLPPERISEVEDFVEFLAERERDREFTRSVAAASLPVFAAIWDNPDDAAYDAL